MNTPLHPNQLRPGDRVRDFDLVRRLGIGGFSFVFLVEREGHRYSMKMAARPVSEDDEDRVDDWMRREVTSLEYMDHPNLLPVLERGRWPDPETGYAWFVTPYIPGSTFHVWRWHERACLHRSVGVLCKLLHTLEALHERGVYHRDIKADNLLVHPEGDKPYLIDFGTVHLPWARTLTEGLAPGTIYCQPPEAITFLVLNASRQGARLEARPSADLYAFGILLYETLTNCRPFNTRLPLKQLLASIVSTPPPDPRQLAPEAPESLCALTMQLLAKEPSQRPSSARAVYEELERLRGEEGHTAAWQEPARLPSECSRVREQFPGVDMLEEPREETLEGTPEPKPAAPHPAVEERSPPLPEQQELPPHTRAGWEGRPLRYLVALILGLGLLGLGWMLLHVAQTPPLEDGWHEEPTAPASPVPSEKGPQPVPPSSPPQANSTQADSYLCGLLTSLMGVAAAQFVGCATAPVRPDPVGYLVNCSAEARATPVKLGLKPDEQPSFIEPESGTPVSDESIADGGALNLKAGPITASMFAFVKGKEKEVEFKITGEAVTTPRRVYIQFDRLHLADGTILPICGVAVDGLHQYGIPTYAKLPMHGAKVDPARVDKSPGSVVINDPRFETVLQGPEGYYMPSIDLAPPDWR